MARIGHDFGTFRASELGLWRRQLPRCHYIVESHTIVRAITKRLVRRVPATAERDDSSPRQPERRPVRIQNLEIALNPDRAIARYGNFRGHVFHCTAALPLLLLRRCRPRRWRSGRRTLRFAFVHDVPERDRRPAFIAFVILILHQHSNGMVFAVLEMQCVVGSGVRRKPVLAVDLLAVGLEFRELVVLAPLQ